MERVYFTASWWDKQTRQLWSRLPVCFANELYAAGESGMGYRVFVIEFRDGTGQAYHTGGAVDFLEYPDSKGPEDVVRALPHEGRSKWIHLAHHAEYSVCLVTDLPQSSP